MRSLTSQSTAVMMRAEQAAVEQRIPRGGPDSVAPERVAAVAQDLSALTAQVLTYKDEAETWLRTSAARVAREGRYHDPEVYHAFRDRLTWAKRMHQELLAVTATWTKEARRLSDPRIPTGKRERLDLGAVVIERAYRYRFSRTPANGAALDDALDMLASASERWADVRDRLG